jgi:hypothetical protein
MKGSPRLAWFDFGERAAVLGSRPRLGATLQGRSHFDLHGRRESLSPLLALFTVVTGFARRPKYTTSAAIKPKHADLAVRLPGRAILTIMYLVRIAEQP